MTRKTSAILRSVLAFLDAPDRWTKHGMAMDNRGCPVSFDSPEATCFCLDGAIRREIGPDPSYPSGHGFVRPTPYTTVQNHLECVGWDWSTYTALNDACSHEEILSLGREKVQELEALGL